MHLIIYKLGKTSEPKVKTLVQLFHTHYKLLSNPFQPFSNAHFFNFLLLNMRIVIIQQISPHSE